MVLIEDVTWPQPLADLLEPLYETYRERHPWLSPDALAPKSVVREMWEQGMGFTDVVGRYQVARSEGLVLRYLTDAYRALRQTVPATHRTEELDLLVEWLGETVRQVDSSLLDEWEALSDPEHASREVLDHEPPPPPRPLSQRGRVFDVMVRNALWRRVDLVAKDDLDGLEALDATDEPAEFTRDGLGPRDRGLLRRAQAGPHGRGCPRARPSRHLARRRRVARDADHPRPRGPPRLGDRGRGRPARVGRGRGSRRPDICDASALGRGPAAACLPNVAVSTLLTEEHDQFRAVGKLPVTASR